MQKDEPYGHTSVTHRMLHALDIDLMLTMFGVNIAWTRVFSPVFVWRRLSVSLRTNYTASILGQYVYIHAVKTPLNNFNYGYFLSAHLYYNQSHPWVQTINKSSSLHYSKLL